MKQPIKGLRETTSFLSNFHKGIIGLKQKVNRELKPVEEFVQSRIRNILKVTEFRKK